MQSKKRQLLLAAGATMASALLPVSKVFAAPFITASDIDPALIAEPAPAVFTGTLVPVSQFGIWPLQADDTSVTGDYYTKMKTAIAYAKANNVSLQFEVGRYNFVGPTQQASGMFDDLSFSMIGVPDQTHIYLMNPGGVKVRWNWAAGVQDVVVSGLNFYVTDTPTNAINDAQEYSTVLQFTGANNLRLNKLNFNDPFGGAILLRNVTNSAITYCTAIGCYKDSFHCTGTSSNIIYYKCKVIDGGDDGFAVVGYAVTGSGKGQGLPTNIRHVYCEVYGVKFARCMTYVGSLNCINVGAFIDGKIPTARASSSLYPYGGGNATHNQSGFYIAAEVVVAPNPLQSYACYGNQNLLIRDFEVKNCGSGGLFAVQIYNNANNSVPYNSDNIQLVNGKISRSGKTAIKCGGGYAHATNLLFQDIEINDTTNPNGVWVGGSAAGVAGEGAGSAFDLHYVRDFVIKNCTAISTGNSHVINIGATCQGSADIDLITVDINPRGYNGPCILNYDSSANTQMSAVDFQLFIKKQSEGTTLNQAVPNNVGNPYFFARVVNTNGRSNNTLSLEIKHLMTMARNPVFNVAGQPPEQAATDSPYTITNNSNEKRIYNLYGGNVLIGAKAPFHTRTDNSTWIESPDKGVGMYHVDPGESLTIQYLAVPTVNWFPTTGL